MSKLTVQLSEKQQKAVKNESINNNIRLVGLLLGCGYTFSRNKGDFIDNALEGVGIAGTAFAVSSIFFPVRVKDILNFDEQKLDGLGNTPDKDNKDNAKQAGGGGGTMDIWGMAIGATAGMLSDIFGTKNQEQTKQAEANANAQIQTAKERVNLQNAQNTGLVYSSLATNSAGQIELEKARQNQTIKFLAIGGTLALGMFAISQFSKKDKTDSDKKIKNNQNA